MDKARYGIQKVKKERVQVLTAVSSLNTACEALQSAAEYNR